MDEELRKILDEAVARGFTREQLTEIYDRYNAKKNNQTLLKKEPTEPEVSASGSVGITSNSDSGRADNRTGLNLKTSYDTETSYMGVSKKGEYFDHGAEERRVKWLTDGLSTPDQEKILTKAEKEYGRANKPIREVLGEVSEAEEERKNIIKSIDYQYQNEEGFADVTDEEFDNSDYGRFFKEVNEYGINKQDFAKYLDKKGAGLKDFIDRGLIDEYLNNQDEIQGDMSRTMAQNALAKVVEGYSNERYKFLREKIKNTESPEERRTLIGKLRELVDGFGKWKEDFAPDLTQYENEKRKEAVDNYKQGQTRTAESYVGDALVGAISPMLDIISFIEGGDTEAEWRLNRELMSDLYSSPLASSTYVPSDSKTTIIGGVEYAVDKDGRVYDRKAKMDITGILSDLGLDYDYVVEKAEQSDTTGGFFSVRNLGSNSGAMVGNLAVQLSGSGFVSKQLARYGMKKSLSNVVGSSITASSMVGASVYEDTYSQLIDAGISEDEAKEHSIKASMTASAVTATTSLFAPNTIGKKAFTKADTSDVVTSFINGLTNSGAAEARKSLARKTIEKLTAYGKEGGAEVIQENIEEYGQTLVNRSINRDIGEEVLNEEYGTKQIIETSAAAFALSFGMAAIGGTRRDIETGDRLGIYETLSTNYDGFTSEINKRVKEGLITAEQAANIKQRIDNYKKYSNTIPDDTPDNQILPIIELVAEKNELETKKKNTDPAFHTQYNERIEKINEEINRRYEGKLGEIEAETRTESDEEVVENVEANTEPTIGRNGVIYYSDSDEEVAKTVTSNVDDQLTFKGVLTDLLNNDTDSLNRSKEIYKDDPEKLRVIQEAEKHFKETYVDTGRIDEIRKKANDIRKKAKKSTEADSNVEENTQAETNTNDNVRENTQTETNANDNVREDTQTETIGEIIDSPVRFTSPVDGKTTDGHIRQDGQRIIFTDGKNEFDLGNVDEISGRNAAEMGVRLSDKVSINPDNRNIVVRGKEYVNNYSDQSAAVNKDDSGNIISVNLETPDGKKRTFKGQVAEDIAYQIAAQNFSRMSEPEGSVDIATKTNYDKFIDTIDTLIDMLDKHTDGTLNALGIIPEAAKVALKAIKAAAQTSKTSVDAIKAGIAALKKTDWYKNLSDEDKAKVNKTSTGDMLKELVDSATKTSQTNKQKAERAVDTVTKKKTKPTKTIVREKTGQKDTSKKIETTEAKLLKDKFKNMQKASKEGAKAIQNLKADFVDYINIVTKGLKGVMTDAQKQALLNRVKNITPKNVGELSNDINTLVEMLTKKNELIIVAKTKTAIRKISKSKAKLTNIRDLAKTALRIDQRFLTRNELAQYETLMQEIINAGRPITDKRYKPVNEAKVRQNLEKLLEKSENGYYDHLAERLGMDGMGLTKKELEALKSSDEWDAEVEKMVVEKEKALMKKLQAMATFAVENLNFVSTDGMRSEFVRQLNILKNVDLSKMTAQELKDLIRIADNIYTNDNFSGVRKVVNNIEAIKASEEIASTADAKIIRPVKGLMEKFLNPFRKVRSTPKNFEKKMADKMFHHLDRTVNGLKGTVLYDNVIHPITAAQNTASTIATQNHIKEAYSLFTKAAGRRGRAELNKKVWIYLTQNEKEVNEGKYPDIKFFDFKEWVNAFKRKKGLDPREVELVDKVANMYTHKDGSSFTAQEIYDTFSPAEKRLVDKMKQDYAERGEALKNHVENYENRSVPFFEAYSPKNIVERTKSDPEPVDAHGNPVLSMGSVKERTSNRAGITDMDAMRDYEKYINDSYFMTNVVPEYNKVMMIANKLAKHEGAIGDLGVAIGKVVEQNVKNNLMMTVRSDNAAMKVFQRFVQNTFSRVLIRPDRFGLEAVANWGSLLLTHPQLMADIVTGRVKGMDSDFMKIMSKEFNSTQTNRFGAYTSDKKYMSSSPFDSFKMSGAKRSPLQMFSDFYTNNHWNNVNDAFTKLYYRFSDPAQFMWKLAVLEEYEKKTGNKLDPEKFKTSEKYRNSIREDLQSIMSKADKKASRIGNTGAASEQKLKAQNRRGTLWGALSDYMMSFGYNEHAEMKDALRGTIGGKNTSYDSKLEAFQMLAMLHVRALAYAYGIQAMATVITNAITGVSDEDDEDIYERQAVRTLGQHAMLVTMGNRSSVWNMGAAILLNMGVEAYVESDGETKYDPFKDGVFFSPLDTGGYTQAMSMFGAGGMAVQSIAQSTEAVFDMVNQGDAISAKRELSAQKAVMGFIGQATGSGIIETGTRYNYNVNRALLKEQEKQEKEMKAFLRQSGKKSPQTEKELIEQINKEMRREMRKLRKEYKGLK